MKQNNFIIVTPFYNVEKWINTTIASVKSQTYKNYKIYFCDDLSKDNSSDVVKKHVDNERIFLIENTEKKLALRNIYETIEVANPNDEDIIITLDGDDWFSRNDALEVVNSYYQDDTLMTYGTYISKC
jgi:glycosyltransferase involved in cell wall biosynthesis